MLIKALLNEANGTTPLYRGIAYDGRVGEVITFSVRNDRKPVTAGILSTVLFDRGAELQFGIQSVRRQSVFATTDSTYAGDYAGNRLPGVVLELQLEPATPILFHPERGDSYLYMEGEDSDVWPDVIKLMTQLAEMRVELYGGNMEAGKIAQTLMRGSFSKDEYLSMSPHALIASVAASLFPDHKDHQSDMISKMDHLAVEMVKGYQLTTAGQFKTGPAVEAIVYGVDNYKAKVVRRIG